MSKTEKARQVLAEKRARGEVGYTSRKETIKSLCLPEDIRNSLLWGLVARGNRLGEESKAEWNLYLQGLSALSYKLADIAIKNENAKALAASLNLAIATLPKEMNLALNIGNMSDAEILRDAAEIIERHGQGALDSAGAEEAEIVVYESDMA